MPRATIERKAACILLSLGAWLFGLSAVAADPMCKCRYAGSMYAEGQCICMNTPNGQQRACCGKVLNNTSWSFTGGCPVSESAPMDDSVLSTAADGGDARAGQTRPMPQQAHRVE